MRSRGIHPGLVCYLNHSASHAGAVTSIGRGHCMIRDSPGSISTRQTSRFFGVFAFFGFGSFFLMRSAIVRRGFSCSNIPCPLCKSPRFRGPSVYIPISLMSIVTMPSTEPHIQISRRVSGVMATTPFPRFGEVQGRC